MTSKHVLMDQTSRSLWSLRNVIDTIPDGFWERPYCGMPLWKHLYHTLHSLDQWYINPFFYRDPSFHTEGLNDLDAVTEGFLSKATLSRYFDEIQKRVKTHLEGLDEESLAEKPVRCPYTRFHLILAQHRHLDMHIGMLMGFLIAGQGLWPRVASIDTDLAISFDTPYF